MVDIIQRLGIEGGESIKEVLDTIKSDHEDSFNAVQETLKKTGEAGSVFKDALDLIHKATEALTGKMTDLHGATTKAGEALKKAGQDAAAGAQAMGEAAKVGLGEIGSKLGDVSVQAGRVAAEMAKMTGLFDGLLEGTFKKAGDYRKAWDDIAEAAKAAGMQMEFIGKAVDQTTTNDKLGAQTKKTMFDWSEQVHQMELSYKAWNTAQQETIMPMEMMRQSIEQIGKTSDGVQTRFREFYLTVRDVNGIVRTFREEEGGKLVEVLNMNTDAFKRFNEKLTDMEKDLKNWEWSLKGIISFLKEFGLGIVAAVVGVKALIDILVMLGAWAPIVAGLSSAWASLVGAVTAGGAAMMAMNPIVAAISGLLIGMALAAYLLYTRWGQLTSDASKQWNQIKEVVTNAWEATTTWLQDKWDSFTGWISQKWHSFAQPWVDAWENAGAVASHVLTSVQTAWDSIGAALASAWASFTQPWVDAWENAKSVAENVLTSVQQAWDNISSALQAAWATFTQPWVDAWENAKRVFTDVVTAIQDAWDNVATAILDKIAAIVSAIGDAANALAGLLGLGGSSDKSGASSSGYAEGGPVRGPGTSKSDSILAWLSNGEFVQSARAVAHYGEDFMHAVNSLRLPRFDGFAGGGLVTVQLAGAMPRFADGGPVKSQMLHPVSLHFGGESVAGLLAPEHVARQLGRFASQKVIARAGKTPGWYKG
jgi:hypothetical protein